MANEVYMLASDAQEARQWLPPKVLSICIELNCGHCDVPVMLAKDQFLDVRMKAKGEGRIVVVLCKNCSAIVVAKSDATLIYKHDDPDFIEKVRKYRLEMN